MKKVPGTWCMVPGIWSGADRKTEIQMNRKTDLFKQFYKMIHT